MADKRWYSNTGKDGVWFSAQDKALLKSDYPSHRLDTAGEKR